MECQLYDNNEDNSYNDNDCIVDYNDIDRNSVHYND